MQTELEQFVPSLIILILNMVLVNVDSHDTKNIAAIMPTLAPLVLPVVLRICSHSNALRSSLLNRLMKLLVISGLFRLMNQFSKCRRHNKCEYILKLELEVFATRTLRQTWKARISKSKKIASRVLAPHSNAPVDTSS